MVVRFTVFMGLLLGVLSWVLLVPLAPDDFQASAGSGIDDARAAGLMPEPGKMKMSGEVGHEVFEVPASDAEHMAEVMAAGGGMAGMEGMPGMQMGEKTGQPMPGMQMGEQAEQPMPGVQMGEQAEQPMPGMKMGEQAEQPMPGMQMGEMKEGEPMPGMQMGEKKEDEHAEQPMPGMQMGEQAEKPMPGMQMGETKEGEHAEKPMEGMAMGGEAGHGEEAEGGGSGLTVMDAGMAGMAGRTVEVELREWGFSPAKIDVKAGETIRFVMTNKGNIPHEFMFMPGAAMQAVNYRLERADWNLLEHEAPYEQAIVLPGDSFEVVMRIGRPGTWMYMCMFPYHMQFGMMGVMATEGMSMDMGAMKM